MTLDADQFARQVADSMTRIRGWTRETVPADVRDDVFNSMTRHNALYVAGFTAQDDPGRVAEVIQNAEWNRARDPVHDARTAGAS